MLNLSDFETVQKLDVREVAELSTADLRTAVSTLEAETQKRLKQFEDRHKTSPAVEKFKEGTQRYSTKNTTPAIPKEVNQADLEKVERALLLNRYKELKYFLARQTSTVEGQEKAVKEGIERLAERGIDVTEDEYVELEKIYSELEGVLPALQDKDVRYHVKTIIRDMLREGKSNEEIKNYIYGNIDTIVQEAHEIANQARREYQMARKFNRGGNK